MNIRTISEKNCKELPKLDLSKNIINTEAQLFRYKEKSRWDTRDMVAKVFYNNFGDGFGNKLLTLNALVDLKDDIDIEELVMPDKLLISGNKIIGYTMPYIDNINLKDLYSNPKVDKEVIIKYLKQIGEIFRKIEKVNKNSKVSPFYLNDVHEANFIIDKKTDHIKAVDIDSVRISNNKPFAAKYLTPFSTVADVTFKYHVCEEPNAIGYIEPDMNSDLYCYNIMILNCFYCGSVEKMSIPEFYNYINYLNSIGYPHELLDSFNRLYINHDNVNPMDLLDEIPKDSLYKAHKIAYSLKK